MMRCLLSVGDFSFWKFCRCFPRRGCRGGSCTCTTDLLLWRAVSRNSDFWFSLFVTTAATTFFWLLLWLLCWRLWLGRLCLWLWLTLCYGGRAAASGTGTWTSTRTTATKYITSIISYWASLTFGESWIEKVTYFHLRHHQDDWHAQHFSSFV